MADLRAAVDSSESVPDFYLPGLLAYRTLVGTALRNRRDYLVDANVSGASMILQVAEPPVATIMTGSRLPNSANADRELQRRVGSFLVPRLPQSSRLRIEADNGVVTLRGKHTSFYHKQLCINCCQRVAGVVQLIDMTKVVPPY